MVDRALQAFSNLEGRIIRSLSVGARCVEHIEHLTMLVKAILYVVTTAAPHGARWPVRASCRRRRRRK